MRLIFFPVDGVICPGLINYKANPKPQEKFDKMACHLLEKLCLEARAKLVITSYWALDFKKEELTKMLGRLGFFLCEGDGWKLDFSGKILGLQIRDYLEGKVGIENYVIIHHSLSRFSIVPDQVNRFVQTELLKCFQKEEFDKALELLTNYPY